MTIQLKDELRSREHHRTDPVTSRYTVYREGLEAALREVVEGEARFDRGSRALYSTDGSNYRQVPIGVVIPRSVDDVVAGVAVCRQFGAPIVARGGGTSLAGQVCNVAVVFDMSKYLDRVLEIDPDRKLLRTQPGALCDTVRDAPKRYNLVFGPDPSTHKQANIGGMIGNDSCGTHSQMAGRTADNIHEMEILTYDGARFRVGPTPPDELQQIIAAGGRQGEIYARMKALIDKYEDDVRRCFPRIPRRVSGYNLDNLLAENNFNVARALVGSEGTLAMVLEATVNLVYSPPCRSLAVLGYEDVATAADHVVDVLPHQPIGLEGLDATFVNHMKKKGLKLEDIGYLTKGGGWLLVEFGGDSKKESDEKALKMMADVKRKGRGAPIDMKLYDDSEAEAKVWEVRESGLGADARTPGEPDCWEGWEDSAVPPDKIGGYLRDFAKLQKKYGYESSLYGHFGQGCLHCRINFDLKTKPGIEKYRAFIEEAADMVLRYGGSFSGEHGDGQARGELLPKMFGPRVMEAFREFKSIWDPEWKMNPGKKIDPYSITANLRLGADYNPPEPVTHFKFPADKFSFSYAMERCVGDGKCRRMDQGGVMCPSYRVTHEEMHTTRGRARLLFEMLQGDPLKNGWKDEAVKEALDLCLACKGCKGDCPVSVDMATYKAEFLSHYYEGRARPRHAYAFGLIMTWAKLASRIPRLANLVTHAPVLSGLAKRAAGMAPERTIPSFAPVTFREWFARREKRVGSSQRVVLWVDTFNNYFHPAAAAAAVEVLETAGFHVDVVQQQVCCGRPLYDYGFLDLAERFLLDVLTAMRSYIIDGVPVVVLEPSCASVFKDEMGNLLPHNLDAHRLADQVFLLSDFLLQKAKHWQLPRLERKAIFHGHCHHKAMLGIKPEHEVFKKMGLEIEEPDKGCCGMAGAFGFEEGQHYEVSLKVGGLGLIPAVQKAPKDQIVIADGFSCREQISQTSDRKGLHLSQVILMALREGRGGPSGGYPERQYYTLEAAFPGSVVRSASPVKTAAAVGAGALLIGGAVAAAVKLANGHSSAHSNGHSNGPSNGWSAESPNGRRHDSGSPDASPEGKRRPPDNGHSSPTVSRPVRSSFQETNPGDGGGA